MLGSGGSPSNQTRYNRDSSLLIASASKWWFGAYVAELHGGVLTNADLKALRMLSGYHSLNYSSCTKIDAQKQAAETVEQCYAAGNNDYYTKRHDGDFYYSGGHFQKYAAVDLGLGSDNSKQLGMAIAAAVGTDLGIQYDSPQLAAGGITSPAHYAAFLRKLLNGQLKLSSLLGANPVCTQTRGSSCPTAISTPIPSGEAWHYSIAHWVEDDPAVGDGAFSSPGAFGFYPWISKDKASYGLLARYDTGLTAYVDSVDCGRLIRAAYQNPAAQ